MLGRGPGYPNLLRAVLIVERSVVLLINAAQVLPLDPGAPGRQHACESQQSPRQTKTCELFGQLVSVQSRRDLY